MPLRVLVVSGIWPPAVGGPATHAPDVCAFLRERGHRVEAVTAAFDERTVGLAGLPLTVLRQDRPLARRLVEGVLAIARAARRADVVYATGLYARSAVAARLAGRPLVVKLVSDPAYDRARSLGWFAGMPADFPRRPTDPRLSVLTAMRTSALRSAARVVTPSAYLADVAAGWGVERPVVIPNPRPEIDTTGERDALQQRFGLPSRSAVFAGRLVPAKDLRLALDALAAAPGWTLVIVGDGPDRPALERHVGRLGLGDRVRLVGARPRNEVLEWLAAADVSLLSSAWETHPHAALESLAVGTPVIATAVGGVGEIVEDGRTGLLVPAGDAAALAAALRRCADEPGLLDRLRANVAEDPGGVDRDEAYAALERVLVRVAPARS